MSTLVDHLWLCLTDMKEQEKVQFQNTPVSQTGLFGDAVENCALQFSAAQKQTEAIKHIMCQRKPAASTPAATLQPAHHRGCPPCDRPWRRAIPAFRQAVPWSRSQAGLPAHPDPCQTRWQAQVQEALRWRELLVGRWCLHYSLPCRRAGWILFCFVLFLFPKHK